MASQEIKQILVELQKFQNESQFTRVKTLLSIEITKVEAEISAMEKKAKAMSNISTSEQKTPIRTKVDLTEHAFDESDKYVKIFIPFSAAKIADENVTVEFTSSSFMITISTETKDYRFQVIGLLKPINVEKSYKKVKSQDEIVALYLKKEKEGVKWGCLTSTEKRLKESKTKTFEDKEKDSSTEDPMGGLMDIMKKMYDSGDQEMKRTIAKAWTEGQEKSRKNQML